MNIYLAYPYVETLAGIHAVWALALEAMEAARRSASEDVREVRHRDFSSIKPAGTCYFRRSKEPGPGRGCRKETGNVTLAKWRKDGKS